MTVHPLPVWTRLAAVGATLLVSASLVAAPAAYADAATVPGTFDAAFSAAIGAETSGQLGLVTVVQPDGKILVGGIARGGWSGLSRLDAQGRVDSSFDIGDGFAEGGEVYGLAVQPDGKIIVTGIFTSFDGTTVNKVVRLLPDGELDTSFVAALGQGPEGGSYGGRVLSVALQPDGKILLGGEFDSFDGESGLGRFVRLTSSGEVDTLPANPNGPVRDIAVRTTPDGFDIVIAGGFSALDSEPFRGVAVLDDELVADPQAIAGLGSGLNGDVFAAEVDADGGIVVGGRFVDVDGITAGGLVRFNADGTLDSAFVDKVGAGFVGGTVMAIAIDTDGTLYVGGDIGAYSGSTTPAVAGGVTVGPLARLTPDGDLDLDFSDNVGTATGLAAPLGLALQSFSNGARAILVTGELSSYRNVPTSGLARFAAVGDIPPATMAATPAAQRITARVGQALATQPITTDMLGAAEFSVSPALPTGLTLDADTGVISGRPTAVLESTDFTVTATALREVATATVSLVVVAATSTLTLSTSDASAGSAVVAVATGFGPRETITLVLHSDPVTVAAATADATGTLRLSVTIPAGTASGAHQLIATGSASAISAGASLAVAGPASQLAATGVGDDPAALAGGAVALLLLGCSLFAVARRRRTTAGPARY